MHTREHARANITREIQRKKKEMYDVISKWEKDSMATGAAQHLSIQLTPSPNDSHLSALLPYQSNNTQIQNARSKLEQKELYDAISKAKKMALSSTYNIRGSNNSRVAQLAGGVTAGLKETATFAFDIIIATVAIGAIVVEVAFHLFIFAFLVCSIVYEAQVAYKEISEDKVEN